MHIGDYRRTQPSTFSPAHSTDHMTRGEVRELAHRFDRLQLAFNALWELIRENTKLKPEDLEAKIQEIDARDGKADGKIGDTPLRCPVCQRVSSSKHWKCLYCGQEFERPFPG